MDAQPAKHRLQVARTLLQTGMFGPTRPDRPLRALAALRRWGPTPAAAYASAAARYPAARGDRRRARDARPSREVQRRTNALADELKAHGVGARRRRGDHVPQPSRLHRRDGRLLEARRQRAVPEHGLRRAPDHRCARARGSGGGDLRRGVQPSWSRPARAGRRRFVAWSEPGARAGSDAAARGADRAGASSELQPPPEKGRVVILTSGTTGAPKGAARKQPDSLEPAAALFSKIPLRARRDDDDRRAAVPLLGLRPLHACPAARARRSCCAGASTPRRRSRAVAQHRASALVVVPVMLQRILDLGPRDDRALRRALAAGDRRSAARRCRASWRRARWTPSATCSTTSTAPPRWRGRRSPRPRTCARAPGTAGRPPMGTVVKLLDEDGREVPPGEGGPHLRRPTR